MMPRSSSHLDHLGLQSDNTCCIYVSLIYKFVVLLCYITYVTILCYTVNKVVFEFEFEFEFEFVVALPQIPGPQVQNPRPTHFFCCL